MKPKKAKKISKGQRFYNETVKVGRIEPLISELTNRPIAEFCVYYDVDTRSKPSMVNPKLILRLFPNVEKPSEATALKLADYIYENLKKKTEETTE